MGEIAGEGTRGLRARSLRPIHVEWQAEHQRHGVVGSNKLEQPGGVGGEPGAGDGLERRRRVAQRIRHRDANGPGAQVEAEQFAGWGDVFFCLHQEQKENIVP